MQGEQREHLLVEQQMVHEPLAELSLRNGLADWEHRADVLIEILHPAAQEVEQHFIARPVVGVDGLACEGDLRADGRERHHLEAAFLKQLPGRIEDLLATPLSLLLLARTLKSHAMTSLPVLVYPF